MITENKCQENIEINFSDFDLIFSLGGDGTFLRTSYFINDQDKLLVGVNTDSDHSFGHYCALSKYSLDDSLDANLLKILKDDVKVRFLDKHIINVENRKKFYFINDLFFGEKHLGSVSKYSISTDIVQEKVIKSSGIICSTRNIFILYRYWVFWLD